jgi:hypothetical protein
MLVGLLVNYLIGITKHQIVLTNKAKDSWALITFQISQTFKSSQILILKLLTFSV